MTLRSYLWGVRLSMLGALLAWGIVVFSVDPDATGFVGQILFYGSFFLFLASAGILFFTWLRKHGAYDDIMVAELGVSFRQGAILALLFLVLMLFQQWQILVWWDALLVTAGIFLIELYFLTR